MTRRAVAAEHGVGAAVEQPVDELDGAAGGVQRGLIGARAGDRVGVEMAAALGRDPLDRVDVLLRMHRRQVRARRPAATAPAQTPTSRVRTARARSRRSSRAARDGGRCRARASSGAPGTRTSSRVPYCPLPPAESQVMAPQVAVVGAGAAGLYTALCAAREGGRVRLISATPLAQSSSWWAQGGLAAAMSSDDSPGRHLADTIAAGRGAVRESAARVLCEEAPHAVEDLARLGVRFDADRHGSLSLGLEGGHRARRIVHAGGAATGRRIVRQLSALVAEDQRIEVARGRARGRAGDRRRPRAAGSCSTTARCSPPERSCWPPAARPRCGRAPPTRPAAIGGGLLLAHAAGATLADLELMQFHPTAVSAPNGADGFLVTEAVRGEGALLLDAAGERFVDELAPRDEVARAVQRQMAMTGASAVGSRHARGRPGAVPQRGQRAAPGRDRPGARARAGRAGRPLHDGRDRHRPRRARHAPRPVRGRRVLLHRPARRQPARLQLAHRVLRVRRPRGPRGAGRAARRRDPRRRRPPPDRLAQSRPPPAARPCGATPGSSATPTA